jgi:hypothetical protein
MYNQQYPVPLTKGSHTIQVANTGGGSFVAAYGLKNYLLKNGPDIEVRGLQADDYILLWLKNPKYTVLHELMKIKFDQQPAGRLELKDVPDGSWTAEWVNTINAKPVRTELVRSTKNRLVLITPEIGESVAVRLHRVN